MATPVVDAVIIGAGHNGLVAANVLADAGWRVVVLEGADQAGGAVRSGEITAPGFINDLCSAFYPFATISPALRMLDLADYGLRWRHAPHVLAHVLPDGRAALLDRDPDVTAISVDGFAGGDGQRWLDLVDQWDRLEDDLLGALFAPFPPIRAGWRFARHQGVANLLRLGRRFVLPARRLGDELFRGVGAKLLLAGSALHTDLALDEAGSGVYGWLLAMVAQRHGFPVPEGGAGRLTSALVTRLEKAGGELAVNSSVSRIVTRAGRAVGVITADGRSQRVRRAVLADVAAPALYGSLLAEDAVPARVVADLRNFTWDSATVKVDWALSGPVPWRDARVSRAGTVHLDCDLEGLSAYGADLANGRVPRHPFVLAGQMTTADPSRSPSGTEAMWAYTHLPQRSAWPPGAVDAHVELVEGVIEAHAPGFRALIRGRAIHGPDEMAAGNPNLHGGAIAGGTAAIHQQLFLRPTPGLGRADTPVQNLFLCSASAHPGGGVHGMPGLNAARAALASARPVTGWLYRRAIGAAHHAVHGGLNRATPTGSARHPPPAV